MLRAAQSPLDDPTVRPNAADGSVEFGEIAFGPEDVGKTYVYRVAEIVPEEAGAVAGMEYDTRVLEYRVTVSETTGNAEDLDVAVEVAEAGK